MQSLRPTHRLFAACLATVVLALVQVSVASGQTVGRTRLTAADLARRVGPTVVTITTASGSGSGVIVDANGTIVSALHVVRGDTSASVKLANGDVYDDVQVLDVDARKDLVVLRIKAFGLSAAQIGNSDGIEVGDPAFAFGSPSGLQNTLSNGLISAIRDSGEGYRLFQTTAAISPGSSGGGLFSEYGELVGIVQSKITNAENINFVVPINYARGLLSTSSTSSLADLARRYPAPAATSETPARTADAAATALARGRLEALLKETGLTFTPAGDLWETAFKGIKTDTMKVYVSIYGEFVLVSSMSIWTKALTAPEMTALMKRSFQEDLVKLGLSDKAALLASAEAEMRGLDAKLLKRMVEAVATCADAVFGMLSTPSGEYAAVSGPPRFRDSQTLSLSRGAMSLQFEGRDWKPFGQRSDMAFVHSSGSAYFRVEASPEQIPYENIEAVALAGAKKAAPDGRVVKRGWQVVNGQKVMVLEIEGTLSAGIPIVYYNHYISSATGTFELMSWSAKNLIDEYRGAIDAVVSGFKFK